jgi:hypothetical protein
MLSSQLARRVLPKLALVLFGLLVAFVVAEIGLRLAGVSYPSLIDLDPDIGRSYIPGARGWYAKEGRSYVQINSDGLRDQEHSLSKPGGVVRIAVLGDSMAAALEVPMEQTFWKRMEKQLAGCPAIEGQGVEVINFGVGGFATSHALLMLRKKALRYDPDVVLLAFFAPNDVWTNNRALGDSNDTPYFHLREGELVLDPSFDETRADRDRSGLGHRISRGLNDLSRVHQVYRQASWAHQLRALREAPAEEKPNEEEPGGQAGDARELIDLNQGVYSPPQSPEWHEAWAITEELLRLIRAESERAGARFMLVSLSGAEQVRPGADDRAGTARRLGVDDLLYPERRLEAFAAAEAMPYLALTPGLQQWADTNQVCIHGFDNAVPCGGHWNEVGHRLASERIAEALCRELGHDR